MNPEDEALREFESEANKTAIARQHAMEAAERTCLGLRIEIQQWKQRAEKAEAALQPRNGHTFDSLQKMWEETHIELARTISERNQLKDAKDKAEAESKSAAQREDALRRELIGHREKAQGNYWAWQGDNDHLETLVRHCPVLIQAKDLQEIISKREKAEAACAEKHALIRELHAKLSEGCKVYFEQDGKPIDIVTDLGEAYQESVLWEKVDTHLNRRAMGSLCPCCGEHIYEDEASDHTDEGLAHVGCIAPDIGDGHIPVSEFDKTIEALKIARRAMEWHAWNKSSDHDCIEFVAIRAVNDDIFRLESLRKEPVEPISGEEFREWLKKMDAKKESLRKEQS